MNFKDNYCAPPDYIKYSEYKISSNSDSVLVVQFNLKNDFSEQSILMANALNLCQEINDMKSLKTDFSESTKIRKIEIREKINNQILQAQAELNAISSELDCEGERIEQIAKYVDSKNASK